MSQRSVTFKSHQSSKTLLATIQKVILDTLDLLPEETAVDAASSAEGPAGVVPKFVTNCQPERVAFPEVQQIRWTASPKVEGVARRGALGVGDTLPLAANWGLQRLDPAVFAAAAGGGGAAVAIEDVVVVGVAVAAVKALDLGTKHTAACCLATLCV